MNAILCGMPVFAATTPGLDPKPGEAACPDCGKVCPFCRSAEHFAGYGLAAGGMGTYTLCGGCEHVFNSKQDEDGGADGE